MAISVPACCCTFNPAILLLATLLPLSVLAQTSTDGDSKTGDTRTGGFNYYFVLVAIACAAFVFFLFLTLRRKRRNQMLRQYSQRALSRDVSSFHNTPRREGWGWPTNPTRHAPRREERPEGLNEAGEAPPPYVPGSKPPSLRSNDGLDRHASSRSVERRADVDLELGDMSRPKATPPPYQLPGNGESEQQVGGVSRPDPAITTEEGPGSTRRFLGRSLR